MLKTITRKKIILADRHCEMCSSLIVRNTKAGTKRISPKQYIKTRFCSIECKGKYQSINNVGDKNYNFKNSLPNCTLCSKKLTVYRKSENIKCRDCYNLTNKGENHVKWKGKTILNKTNGRMLPPCINCKEPCGDKASVLCRKCYRGAFSPLWRGGTSALSTTIRATKESLQWKKRVMFRDSFTCQECKAKNQLQVHHIKPFSKILRDNNISSVEEALSCEELWNTDNGVTLCIPCHKLTDSYANKKII